jgi:anti-sigma-K factor RskA
LSLSFLFDSEKFLAMATTTVAETRPTFSRLTERKRADSWKAAIPAVAVIVAFVALLAYMASKISSYSQELANSQRDAAASRQQYEGALKRNAELSRDLTIARSAGRTTVILRGKDKDTQWAAATWGESEGGKSWMRVSAYGLPTASGGKSYRAWFIPQNGEPVQIGTLDPDNDGSAFVMSGNLPAIDQGKSVVISLDSDNAKAPEQVVIEAPLPALKVTMPASAPTKTAPAIEVGK